MSKLPPTSRDVEIYESIHIQHCSTWQMADRHHISQTRVRQIIRRVVEWLGEVLPPQTKLAKEQEIRLAREIAADRFQNQLEEATTLWQDTRESKYSGIRIRLTTAQARLGAVGGVAAGLLADASEGLPVPAYEPPPEPQSRLHTRAPAKQVDADPNGPATPDTDEFPEIPDLEIAPTYPPDPVPFCEITEQVIATREAAGCPFPFKLIKALYEEGYLPTRKPTSDSQLATPDTTPRSRVPSECRNPHSPPVRDFSASSETSADGRATVAVPIVETISTPATCDDHSAAHQAAPNAATTPSQPLLTADDPQPITEVGITPYQPGATISQTKATASDPPLVASSPDPRLMIPTAPIK